MKINSIYHVCKLHWKLETNWTYFVVQTMDCIYLFGINSVSIQFGFDLLVDTYHFYLSLFVQLNHYQRDYWLVNYWLLSETKEIHFGLSMCFYWRGMHVRSKSFLMWFNPLAMTFQVKMFTFLNAHDSCSAKTTLWTLPSEQKVSSWPFYILQLLQDSWQKLLPGFKQTRWDFNRIVPILFFIFLNFLANMFLKGQYLFKSNL